MDDSRVWSLCPLFCLFCGMAVMGQVIHLGDSNSQIRKQTSQIEYAGEDAVFLNNLSLVNYRKTTRKLNNQDIVLETFYFQSFDSAFSAFTFLRKIGAKSFSGMEDCYLQHREMLFWKGKCVTRTHFSKLPQMHLSAFVDWMRSQFQQRAPLPAVYLGLPVENLLPASRRYLVRDFQVSLLWPELQSNLFLLDKGCRLAVAQYRCRDGRFWSGWLAEPNATLATSLSRLNGRYVSPSEKYAIRVKPFGRRFAIYLGPDDPEIWKPALEALNMQWQSRITGEDPRQSNFFRRDQFSYTKIIRTGMVLVFFFIAMAALLAVIFIGSKKILEKTLHLKAGLEKKTVCRLDLIGGDSEKGKK